MEERPRATRQPLEARKGKKMDSSLEPSTPGKNIAMQHLGLSAVRPILDF